ncbi:hypothetical protein [Nocardioides houyundeii]|uniref:hypothetical protein n=1 Tax=Nocardioides houyundeii TaxID=2045452 RepID=UPI0013B37F2D|nr:hypothetical protein [Nocardioides houyundeii]
MATGKRAGSRRATPSSTRSASSIDPKVVGYAGGITACVVAWGYLVYAAIDFGSAARSGSGGGWALLVLASIGAAACLFVGLMLATRLSSALGFSSSPNKPAPSDPATTPADTIEMTAEPPKPAAPRPPGGRRISRK